MVLVALLAPLTLSQRSHAEDPVHKMPLTSMDSRSPLPLLAMMAEHQKQNMREHLMAIQAIVAAIARDDLDGVTTAASRIGYSPSTSIARRIPSVKRPGVATVPPS